MGKILKKLNSRPHGNDMLKHPLKGPQENHVRSIRPPTGSQSRNQWAMPKCPNLIFFCSLPQAFIFQDVKSAVKWKASGQIPVFSCDHRGEAPKNLKDPAPHRGPVGSPYAHLRVGCGNEKVHKGICPAQDWIFPFWKTAHRRVILLQGEWARGSAFSGTCGVLVWSPRRGFYPSGLHALPSSCFGTLL